MGVWKLDHVSQHIWAFHTGAASVDNKHESDDKKDRRSVGIWVPGCGHNHNTVPNVMGRCNSEANGVDFVALVDIPTDDELCEDCRTFRNAPSWLKDWAAKHEVSINHPDCNNFVVSHE